LNGRRFTQSVKLLTVKGCIHSHILATLTCSSVKTSTLGRQVGLSMPVISALRRLRQENHQFKASLGYPEKSCLKQQQQ
jgi:hypothetical protein